ncbi:amino acid adenylation domain-containing protein [Nocardia sp. NPDC004068]|uniref:non-ribosomal peptide synthetase n=1 Tax=Nocardia sp. NPDC004068 TaxID=3364303 RepID=UPI003694FBBD
MRAAEQPGATAVAWMGGVLCYRELDRWADRLARLLRARGVGPEVVVGVWLPREPRLIVALLAVLRAGGAYLPLDPGYPAERLRHIVSDARPRVVVTAGDRALPGTVVVDLDRDAEVIAAQDEGCPEGGVRPDNSAYVIYTSGSTGAPKGVVVPHRGLSHLVDWHIARYGLTRSDRCAQVAALGFDASVWEIWPVLVAGAGLHLPPEGVRGVPDRLTAWLAERRITVTFLPTPLAQEVLRDSRHREIGARALLVGGDALTAAPTAGTPFAVVNHYGPTENTVVATAGEVSPGGPGLPSIGRPIEGVRAVVLDDRLRPVLVGTPGELWLGGDGLARGYLGGPGRTAERFVADPAGGGRRLYRTGDMVSVRPDGEFDFHGRRDDQISLRGVRIELGEVVAAVREDAAVADATAIVRPAPNGTDQLIAYVIPAEPASFDATALLARLAAVLPAAMVPVLVVAIERFPLTPHGKIDRARLPEPAVTRSEPPRDGLEARLAELWYDMLGLPGTEPNIHANFLALGGHSLLATQLTVRLREQFAMELPTRVALAAPTIAELADLLRAHEPAPGHLDTVVQVHGEVAALSDEEVTALLADLEDQR